MKLAFGSDHAGFRLRSHLADWAKKHGHEITHHGAQAEDATDYPMAAKEVVDQVLSRNADFGILVCGSGTGVAMAANRYKGIRAANCVFAEMAVLARAHNHANVLCLGQRMTTPELGEGILKAFLEAGEDHAERHERRVSQMG